MSTSIYKNLSLLVMLGLLAGCGSFFGGKDSEAPITAAPVYKVGDPYTINGVQYYPKEDFSYDKTGLASWYGPGFHHGRTANGDRFDSNELTAAHPTLPMPSLARITNLENGKSIVVRINDRGPFSGKRLIDVSRRSAELLGFAQQGTARVRVQVLRDESMAIAEAAKHYGASAAGRMYASSTSVSSYAAPAVPAAPVGRVSEHVTVSQLPAPVAVPEKAPPPVSLPPVVRMAANAAVLPPTVRPMGAPARTASRLYVQAGAFKREENANKLKMQLTKFGQATVNQCLINGVEYYRVRLAVESAAKADSLLQKLAQLGVENPKIVTD
ncbi:MAG: septal ring lytic transglycosylase RlpA family protein [Alphaproteobacteria bacterium]